MLRIVRFSFAASGIRLSLADVSGLPRRVLLAFDKFKDALSAERACAVAGRVIRQQRPHWHVDHAPLSDGGEGFCRLLTSAAGGELVPVPAAGPRLERVGAPIGLVEISRLPVVVRNQLGMAESGPGRLAVIEMAAVNGLAMVPMEARDPWRTTSVGTGGLIRAAAELGARAVLLGVGGSATSDLGLGALQALGLEFRDRAHAKVRPPFPAHWERIVAIEEEVFAGIPPIAIACDVSNPLLGPTGAAAVFGPQKGLRPEDWPRHEVEATRLGAMLAAHSGRDFDALATHPGAGAAGGIAFGLMTAARARLVPGFALVAAWLDLEKRLAEADLVLTGEGRFDDTSLGGKGPGAVVQRAQAAGRKVVVLAGAVGETLQGGVDVHAITPPDVPLPDALRRADHFLADAVRRVIEPLE